MTANSAIDGENQLTYNVQRSRSTANYKSTNLLQYTDKMNQVLVD